MERDCKNDNLILLSKEVFNEILIDGLTKSISEKIKILFSTVLEFNDKDLYFEKDIVGIIYLTETLYKDKCDTALNILINKIKMNSIEYACIPEDSIYDEQINTEEVSDSNIKLLEIEKENFNIVDGKKKIKIGSLGFDGTQDRIVAVLRDSYGNIKEETEYILDKDGFVLSETTKPIYDYVDYNEVYVESSDNVMTYEEFIKNKSETTEEDKIINESDLLK